MEIDIQKCVGCGNCIPYCTMGAIRIEHEKAVVNDVECVECNTCFRCCESEKLQPGLVRWTRGILRRLHLRHEADLDICPTGALCPPDLEWPRSLRRSFSDPTVTHDSTGVAGRGTEEIKTNDVTGRIGVGDAGLVIDLGRPGTGVFFRDINRLTQALAGMEVIFEPDNPLTVLMDDPDKGVLQHEILEEKVLSAIIELRLKLDQLPDVIRTVDRVAKTLETVVSVGVSSRCHEDGSIPHLAVCDAAGLVLTPNGKTNLGFGRIAGQGGLR